MSNVSSSNSQGVRVPKLRFPGFEGEWESSLLGEVGTFTKGAPLSKADISEEGTPFILYGELYTTYNEVTNAIVRKTDKAADLSQYSRIGDVIIPTSGETPEEIATATCVMLPNVILAGDLNIFRGTKVDGRIISYIVNHVINRDISRIAQGKSVVHVKADELSKIRINYPNSEEQKKLIRFLEILSGRIEKQRQLVELLKSYKRGALLKLLPQKGETTPQYRFAGFTEPWKQRKIKELFKITRGYVLAASMTNDRQTESTPYPVYSSQTKSEGLMGYYSQYLYEKAITWTTDGANAGTVNFRDGKFYCTNVCGVLLADLVVPDQMISDALNSVAKNHVSYVGNPKLMNNVMAEITLTLPESEKERQVISALLSYYDNLISSHKQKLDELQSLKSGLLQQLFI